ncbi:MAG: hypothetical protein ABR526_03085 [Chthoniobacterales bacterium]
MLPFKNFTRKQWIASTAATLVVGALGSGLWSVVFEPVGSLILRNALSVATLGISAARDDTYQRAAAGFTDRSSHALLSFLAAFVMVLPFILLALKSLVIKAVERRQNLSAVDAEAREQRRANSWRTVNLLIAAESLIVGFAVIQIFLTLYSDDVVSAFRQELAVIAPYITPDERVMYEARFASVERREQFVTLLDELNGVAERHGAKRSKFAPW